MKSCFRNYLYSLSFCFVLLIRLYLLDDVVVLSVCVFVCEIEINSLKLFFFNQNKMLQLFCVLNCTTLFNRITYEFYRENKNYFQFRDNFLFTLKSECVTLF